MPALGTLGAGSQFGFGRSAKITIQRPVITLDTGYSGSSSSTLTRPRFTSSAFTFSNGVPSTAHGSSDWQFSTSSDFSSTLSPQTLSASSANKASYTITTKFAYSTLIYARVRYRDNASPVNVSDWSVPITFTTQPQPVITTPSISSPTQSEFISSGRTITITTSNFAITNDEDGETHTSTTYQVSNVSDFSSTIYNTTSTTNKTTITTSDLGGGTKYIRVKHNGSLGIAASDWSPTRTISIAFADTGAGVGTFYPDSTSFVVTTSKSVTLQPGTYRVNLYGGGGGGNIRFNGDFTSRRGGYAGCVVRDVYLTTASSISFTLGGGGGGVTATNTTGAGGANGGGAGAGYASGGWNGGSGGGGYSSATFPGSIVMYAGGGGGATGHINGTDGRSAKDGTGTEWYNVDGTDDFKILRKGTGAGGVALWANAGTDGTSGYGGGGGASNRNDATFERNETETFSWGGNAIQNSLEVYASFRGQAFSNKNNSTDRTEGRRGLFWSGTNADDVNVRIRDFRQGSEGAGEITPNYWITNNYKTLNVTDMNGSNSEGPYADTNADWSITAKVGYFFGRGRLDGAGSGSNDVDPPDGTWLRYWHSNELLSGDGGSNGGSFGRSFADDNSVSNGYYYAAAGYTFGDAGSSNNGWNGKPGGALIQLISDQNMPSVSITSHPSDVNTDAGSNFGGNGFTMSVSATDTANSANNTSLTYQWQISTNGGSTWSDISGATDSTLRRFSKVYYSDNGHKVRCVVTAVNGRGSSTQTSNVATITVARASYQRVDPILPYTTSYGTNTNLSLGEQLIGSPPSGSQAAQDWSNTTGVTLRNISQGIGRFKFKWNTEIRVWKDDARSGLTGCTNGQGMRWDIEYRLAVVRSDNVIVWDSHGRWHTMEHSMIRSSTDYRSSNWDFNNTVDLDPTYSHKLIVQFQSKNTERCQCSGGSYINCQSQTEQGWYRFRIMSNGYYSQTSAFYPYDTRPSLDGYTRG